MMAHLCKDWGIAIVGIFPCGNPPKPPLAYLLRGLPDRQIGATNEGSQSGALFSFT